MVMTLSSTLTAPRVLHSVSPCEYSPWRRMMVHAEFKDVPVKSS
jgi:hypothetical protein